MTVFLTDDLGLYFGVSMKITDVKEFGQAIRKILIVEDDAKLAEELAIFLTNNACSVDILSDFCDTSGYISESDADLVLLDINLPVSDGQSVLRKVRAKSDIPVIMITSRDSEIDELVSMNYGADDYVTKPFNTHILLAKIDAVLRRVGKTDIRDMKLHGGGFSLNIADGVISTSGGGICELTKNESRILQFLLKNRGKIAGRDELMGYIWDSDEFVDDNTLTVNVTRLREKLAGLGIEDAIVTKRGQGYMLR